MNRVLTQYDCFFADAADIVIEYTLKNYFYKPVGLIASKKRVII
jgi:hypothetical protein